MVRGKRVLYWGTLALLLAGWLYIAWNIPYTWDDWDWGLPEGMELIFLPRGSSELWPDIPDTMWAGAEHFPTSERP